MNASLDTVRSQAFVFTYISRLARVDYVGGKLEVKKISFLNNHNVRKICVLDLDFGFWFAAFKYQAAGR
jgi:hypothetical protein